jgi:hypothetical protein
MTGKQRWILVPVVVLTVLLLPQGLILLLLFYIDHYSLLHMPAEECDSFRQGELFCEKRYFDHGHIRNSSSVSGTGNCCIMERYDLDMNRVDYRVLACDQQSSSTLNCRNVETFGSTDWKVDGRKLRVDLTWTGHQSDHDYSVEDQP